VTARLGVSEDRVRLIAEDLSDEYGCITVLGITDEDWTPAFTDQGIVSPHPGIKHLGCGPITLARVGGV
jgi:hypothetical protein